MLIGASAVLLLVFNGRIAGISGILGRALFYPREAWRFMFIAGMLLGALALTRFIPTAVPNHLDISLGLSLFAGLFVGLGTNIGNGCTSGHGICGLGRFSPRSAAAVATFMATAVVTATVWHLIGGAA